MRGVVFREGGTEGSVTGKVGRLLDWDAFFLFEQFDIRVEPILFSSFCSGYFF